MTETRKRKIQNKNKTGGKNKKYKKRGSTIKYKKGGREYTKPQTDAYPCYGITDEKQCKAYRIMTDFHKAANQAQAKIDDIYKQLDQYDPEIILYIQDLIDRKEIAADKPGYQDYIEYAELVDKLNRAMLDKRFYIFKYEKARKKYISKYDPQVDINDVPQVDINDVPQVDINDIAISV